MSDNDAANFDALVSREQAENTVASALRLFVGRGRRYSVKQLANATGVKDRMIECAMARGYDHRPLPDWALMSITKFLGADFANEWLGLAGLVAVDPVGIDLDAIDDNCGDFRAAKARAHHESSPAGRDICPETELPDLIEKAARLKVAK